MITIPTKSANYDPENIKFFHNCHILALEINYFPVLLSVLALLAKQSYRSVSHGARNVKILFRCFSSVFCVI